MARRSFPRRTPLRAALVALALARAASAEPSACQLVVSLDRAELTPEWRGAVDSLVRELAVAGASSCHGVVLVLTADQGGVRVTASAPTGEQTSRRVARPRGLSAVAFGLLAAAPGETPAKTDVPTPAFDPLEVPPREPIEAEKAPAKAPEAWGLSIGAALGARAAFPTHVLVGELEVRGDVRFHAWLVTLDIRAAPVTLAERGVYDSDSYQETTFALGVGRAFSVGRSVLALSGAAGITYVWLENDAINAEAEQAQLRLAAITRWSYPIGRAFSLQVAADGELAPGGIGRGPTQVGLAPFPAVTVGLRLGAEVVL